MKTTQSLIALVILAFVHALPSQTADELQTAEAQDACSPVHIIVARASTELPGYGVTGALAQSLAKDIPGTTAEPVVYPAVLNPYISSENAGVVAMKNQLTAYVKNCPQSKIVLAGYSQGADVARISLKLLCVC